jgi:dipeptidyl aminopeptidase/acylaminoacyl peptidase
VRRFVDTAPTLACLVVRRRGSFVPVVLALALAASASAQPTRRAITVDDRSRTREVSDPQRSPDGQWVAFVVGTTDVEKDKRDSDLWMVRWDGSEEIRLTASPESESRPRWSPDGKSLGFIATRGDEDEKKKGAQVWLLNRAGGEAQKLTDIKGGVSDFAWSPDSSRLALVVNDADPNDDPEKKEGWKRKTRPPIVIDRYHFKQDRDGYLTRLYQHLAIFDLATKTLETLTSGQVDDTSPAWSPDGRRLAFLSKRAHTDPDRTENDDLYAIDARAGAEPRQLTRTPESEGGPLAWSPDGKLVAVLVGEEDKYSAYRQTRLAVVPAEGGAPSVLTAALDRPVNQPAWSPDGAFLVFSFEDDRAEVIGKVPAAGGRIERLTSGRQVVSMPRVGRDGGVAVLAATPSTLPEVHALENGTLRKLSKQNDAWLAGLQLATVEDLESRSKDGTIVHGLLSKPATYVPGQKYPLVLYIHGGPNGQDEYSFAFERELFAANGYVVLEVNYRGSNGRGAAFQKAIFADWGGKEVIDLQGAVDEAVRKGIADPERLGTAGWSYGGILTNALIASDTRFKAAVSGAGSSLFHTMYGTDQYIVQYEHELGAPWASPDLWAKVSYPFFRADHIKTPTLFLCGEKDFNVPISGAEQMYQALRSLGVDTQLVVYPGQFHGLTTPSYQRDRLQRYLDWFGKYLQPAAKQTASGE